MSYVLLIFYLKFVSLYVCFAITNEPIRLVVDVIMDEYILPFIKKWFLRNLDNIVLFSYLKSYFINLCIVEKVLTEVTITRLNTSCK